MVVPVMVVAEGDEGRPGYEPPPPHYHCRLQQRQLCLGFSHLANANVFLLYSLTIPNVKSSLKDSRNDNPVLFP